MKEFFVLILALVFQVTLAIECGTLHCPKIPSKCPTGETLVTPVQANGCAGCPQCTKCALLFCPAVGNCAYGSVTTKQSNGCPGCPSCRKCTPLPCAMPICSSGQTLTQTVLDDGCPGCPKCTTCGILNCPLIPTSCPAGQQFTTPVQSNGCPGCKTCTPVTA